MPVNTLAEIEAELRHAGTHDIGGLVAVSPSECIQWADRLDAAAKEQAAEATTRKALADSVDSLIVTRNEQETEIERLRDLLNRADDYTEHTSMCRSTFSLPSKAKCDCGFDDLQEAVNAALAAGERHDT